MGRVSQVREEECIFSDYIVRCCFADEKEPRLMRRDVERVQTAESLSHLWGHMDLLVPELQLSLKGDSNTRTSCKG